MSTSETTCADCGGVMGGVATFDGSKGCPRCGAMWMPNVAIEALRQRGLEGDVRALVRETDRGAPQLLPESNEPFRSIALPSPSCPQCHAALVKEHSYGIGHRVCPEGHGAFFLRGDGKPWAKGLAKAGREERRAKAKSLKGPAIAAGSASGFLIVMMILGAVLVFALGICSSL